MSQSFAVDVPPMAGSVWLRADIGNRRTFVFGRGVDVAEISAGWLEPGVECILQIILPSGQSIRRQLTFKGADDTHRAASELSCQALQKIGWLDFWGFESPDVDDAPRLFGFRPGDRFGTVSEIDLPTTRSHLKTLKAYRICTTDFSLRVETDGDDHLLNVKLFPAIACVGRQATVDLIPTVTADSRFDLEIIREPSVASTFCRYMDVDANEAARVMGKHLCRMIMKGGWSEESGSLLAAGLYCLTFGSTSEGLAFITFCESKLETDNETQFRNRDLVWICSILNIRRSLRAGHQVPEASLMNILAISRTNLPSCSTVLAYAARLIQELGDRDREDRKVHSWISEYKGWRGWVRSRGVELAFTSDDGIGPVALNVQATKPDWQLEPKKKEMNSGGVKFFRVSDRGVSRVENVSFRWRPWNVKPQTRIAAPLSYKSVGVAPNLRMYELVFLARAELATRQIVELCEGYRSLIEEFQGKVIKTEPWGIRSLAYKINGCRRAHYVLMNLVAPAGAIVELERRMGISEEILRYLTVRVDEFDDGPSAPLRKSDEGLGRPRVELTSKSEHDSSYRVRPRTR